MSRSATKPTRTARPPAPMVPPDLPPGAALGRELSLRTVLFHQTIAERLGLSVTEHKCIDLLDRHQQPMTAGDLARASGLTSGAITGIVDRLESAGFVRREANPADRRQVVIRLVPESMRVFEPLLGSFLRGVAAVINGFDAHGQAIIAEFTTGMIDVLKRETERLRAGAAAAPASPRRRGRPARPR